MLKKFRILTFLFASTIVGLLTILAFVAAFAEDESTLGDTLIFKVFAKAFWIFRFPTHPLFWKMLFKGGPLIYFTGLIINCLLYGFLTERVIYLFSRKGKDA